ncbi:MAG: hypothetical protein PWP03_687, partial [Candidatus Woesearchaeota archaeon]|nr:hypothetical protein [Candidatus Woesearchaeota archaeon]
MSLDNVVDGTYEKQKPSRFKSFLVGALAFGLSLFPVKSFPASNPANDYAVIYNVDINKRNTDLGDINLSFDVETFDDDN